MEPADLERYRRQWLSAELGRTGQRAVMAAAAAVVGCGALGTHAAGLLARAGISRLRLIDGDRVERSNLPRQVLYTEADADAGRLKVEAAAAALQAADGRVALETVAANLSPENGTELLAGVDLIIDGTDNLETRYLMNDLAVSHGTPWVYAGVVAASGFVMPVVPGRSACLRCLFADPPPPGALRLTSSHGVINAAPALAAALQAAAGLRILSGDLSGGGRLVSFDVWRARFETVTVERGDGCPCCGLRRFEFLDGSGPWVWKEMPDKGGFVLRFRGGFDLSLVRERLAAAGPPDPAPGGGVRLTLGAVRLAALPDGSLTVAGAADLEAARTVVRRLLGP